MNALRAVAIAVLAVSVIASVGYFYSSTPAMNKTAGDGDTNAIVTTQVEERPKYSTEYLRGYVLDLINKDRADVGLSEVSLSEIQAAQVHAEDVFKTRLISHWMTNGEKPHMTHTRYGGNGDVNQNVAVYGYTTADCTVDTCEKIDVLEAFRQLEYDMIYNDEACCNNGHRDNILDQYHTDVSIGIAYDDYFAVLVQNFETNRFIQDDPVLTEDNTRRVVFEGFLSDGSTPESIHVWYDSLPSPQVYEEYKTSKFYDMGTIRAVVAPLLEEGYYYEEMGFPKEQPKGGGISYCVVTPGVETQCVDVPEPLPTFSCDWVTDPSGRMKCHRSDYEYIIPTEATKWKIDEESKTTHFYIEFDPKFGPEGVYTFSLIATPRDNPNERFSATSFSVWWDNNKATIPPTDVRD